MNVIGRAVSILIGVLLLGAMSFGVYFGLRFIAGRLGTLDRLTLLVIAGFVVALMAASIIANGMRSLANARQSSGLFTEKAGLYQHLTGVWGGILWHGIPMDDPVVVALFEDLRALDRALILYASAKVLKAQTALLESVRAGGLQSKDNRACWATLIFEMRKDLGSGTTGLKIDELSEWLPLSPESTAGSAKNARAAAASRV